MKSWVDKQTVLQMLTTRLLTYLSVPGLKIV